MHAHSIAVELDYQLALSDEQSRSVVLPSEQQVQTWIQAVLATLEYDSDVQVTVRIVDDAEMTDLNQTYRHKNGATNVLSFPFELPQGMPEDEARSLFGGMLGDIVVCASVVQNEAAAQQKPVLQHWAHMIIHGVLHLLGHDHIAAGDAEQMEGIEVQVLKSLGIGNPYLASDA